MASWYCVCKRVMAVIFMLMVVLQGEGGGRVVAWGVDGHYLVCSIAETMFTQATSEAVNNLIPSGTLADWCSWADQVRRRIRWSASLHFIDTPEVCNYNHQRDCHPGGKANACVAGAITNYTSQLADSSGSAYNLTEALFFLAHFVGDIHQPLHVAFSNDKGANTINVHFFGRKYNLHSIWDTHIIDHAITTLYDSELPAFQDNIIKNITDTNINLWSKCHNNQPACPDKWARESIKDACQWAYEDAPEGSYLDESYFDSRLPIVEQKIAQAGVRLASILNNVLH